MLARPAPRLEYARLGNCHAACRWLSRHGVLQQQREATSWTPQGSQRIEDTTSRSAPETFRKVVNHPKLYDEDIIPGDLNATVQAHRNRNQDSLISFGGALSQKFAKRSTGDPDSPGASFESSEASSDGLHLKQSTADGDLGLGNGVVRSVGGHDTVDVPPRTADDPTLRSGRAQRILKKYQTADTARSVPFASFRNTNSTASRTGNKAWDRCNDEFESMAQWLVLTPQETSIRRALARQVATFISSHVDDVAFETFGSMENGMGSPSSDIDIGFHLPSMTKADGERGPSPTRPAARSKARTKLRHICNLLFKSPSFKNIEMVAYARYPLCQATHKDSGIRIQIVHSRAQPRANDLIKIYSVEYPSMKQLFYTVKAVLKARGLADTKTGGLGSYPLLVMLVAFYKQKCDRSAMVHNSDGLLTLVWKFFKFYWGFNPTEFCLSPDPWMAWEKDTKDPSAKNEQLKRQRMSPEDRYRYEMAVTNKEERPWALCLQDPADPANDVAKGAFRIQDVRITFRKLHTIMNYFWHTSNSSPDDLLKRMVGNVWYDDFYYRMTLHSWASKSLREALAKDSDPAATEAPSSDSVQASDMHVGLNGEEHVLRSFLETFSPPKGINKRKAYRKNWSRLPLEINAGGNVISPVQTEDLSEISVARSDDEIQITREDFSSHAIAGNDAADTAISGTGSVSFAPELMASLGGTFSTNEQKTSEKKALRKKFVETLMNNHVDISHAPERDFMASLDLEYGSETEDQIERAAHREGTGTPVETENREKGRSERHGPMRKTGPYSTGGPLALKRSES